MTRFVSLAVGVTASIALCFGQDPNPKPKEQEQQQVLPTQPPPATPPAEGTPRPAAGTVPPTQPPESAKPPEGQPATPPADTDPLKMATPNATGAKQPTVTDAEKTYILGPDDAIEISVWASPALSNGYMIRPDGRISMPLIGEIVAANLTCVQLGERITERLKDEGILRTPRVVVVLRQVNSKKFQILGEVNKPGSYPITASPSMLEALVNAGGFAEFANKKKIILQRMENGQLKRYKFNYNEVIKGKHLEQNIKVIPGDLIIVK